MPFTEALFKLLAQVIVRCEISHTQTLALHDAAPWFDVIHP